MQFGCLPKKVTFESGDLTRKGQRDYYSANIKGFILLMSNIVALVIFRILGQLKEDVMREINGICL